MIHRHNLQCWWVLFFLLSLTHIDCLLYSLGCKALDIDINFLVLWSLCLSSSLVHIKNSPEYLIRRTAQVLIPLLRFLLYCLVSRNVIVLLRYAFLTSFFICVYLMGSISNIPNLAVLFLPLIFLPTVHYQYDTFFKTNSIFTLLQYFIIIIIIIIIAVALIVLFINYLLLWFIFRVVLYIYIYIYVCVCVCVCVYI